MRKKIPLIKRYKKPLPKYGAGGTQLAIGAADMGANIIESTNESDDYGRVNATKSVATGTLKGAAAGAANRIGGVYQGAKQKVGGMVDNAVQGAKNVGSGIASAAGEVAGNVEDIYKSGQQAGTQADLLANAKKSIDALTDALRQTDEAGLLGNNRGQFMNLPLKNILAKLEQAQSQSQTSAQGARDKGVFGGAGQAFRQGMQS